MAHGRNERASGQQFTRTVKKYLPDVVPSRFSPKMYGSTTHNASTDGVQAVEAPSEKDQQITEWLRALPLSDYRELRGHTVIDTAVSVVTAFEVRPAVVHRSILTVDKVSKDLVIYVVAKDGRFDAATDIVGIMRPGVKEKSNSRVWLYSQRGEEIVGSDRNYIERLNNGENYLGTIINIPPARTSSSPTR